MKKHPAFLIQEQLEAKRHSANLQGSSRSTTSLWSIFSQFGQGKLCTTPQMRMEWNDCYSPARTDAGHWIRSQETQCSVPNQIEWTSKVEGKYIILPRLTLPWHLVATSFHFIRVIDTHKFSEMPKYGGGKISTFFCQFGTKTRSFRPIQPK